MNGGPAQRSARPWGWAALWLLPLLYWTARFWPALAHGQLLFGSDTVALGLPQELAARRLWNMGLWPHWLPGLYGGMPGMAALNLNFQYPSFLLAAVLGLPPAQAFGLDAWIHVLVATAGSAFLGRRLGLGQGAALLTGLSFGASGSVVSLAFAGHANNLRAIALIPWVLGLWAWGWQAQGPWRSRGAFALAGLALALQILAGGLQIFAYTVPVLAAFAVWLAWAQRLPRRPQPSRRAWQGPALTAAFCLALSAPLLGPAWLHQSQSWHQRLSYEDFSSWSFPPQEALQWFLPGAFGWRDPTYTGEWPICLTNEYLGLLPWALGAWALWQARGQRRHAAWFCGFLALSAFAVGLGKHLPLHRLFYHLPVYQGFRSWTRALCFVTLALSLLAGFGWQALLGRWPPSSPGSGRASAWLTQGLLGLLLVLHLADTQRLHGRFIEFREAAPYSATPVFLRGLPPPDPSDPFRVHVDPRFQAPNAAAAAGYESEGGYHALPLSAPRALRQALSQRLLAYLALLNVRYLVLSEKVEDPALRLVSQQGAWVYENRLCLPRARFVPVVLPLSGMKEGVFDLLKDKDLDYARVALAEGAQARSEAPDPSAVVRWSEQGPLRQRFEAKSRAGGLLVVSQSWYPNWRAWVDGRPAPLLKVFGALQGLELGPGPHTVELRYVDRRFQAGILVMLAGLLGLGALSFLAWRERRPWRSLVVVPTYDERANVQALLPALLRLKPALQVLVVDDASPDGTALAVKALVRRYPGRVHLLQRPAKAGLGTAYGQGFQWGLQRGFEALVQMDADLSHDPADVPRLLAALKGADLALGTRYQAGRTSVVNWPLRRLALSRLANKYVRLVTGLPLSDATGGFKAWRAALLRSVVATDLHSDGYSFQVEMNHKAWKRGARLVELPIVFTDRREGQSKLDRRIIWEAVWRVWALRFSLS